jgi:hypothetical protein
VLASAEVTVRGTFLATCGPSTTPKVLYSTLPGFNQPQSGFGLWPRSLRNVALTRLAQAAPKRLSGRAWALLFSLEHGSE